MKGFSLSLKESEITHFIVMRILFMIIVGISDAFKATSSSWLMSMPFPMHSSDFIAPLKIYYKKYVNFHI